MSSDTKPKKKRRPRKKNKEKGKKTQEVKTSSSSTPASSSSSSTSSEAAAAASPGLTTAASDIAFHKAETSLRNLSRETYTKPFIVNWGQISGGNIAWTSTKFDETEPVKASDGALFNSIPTARQASHLATFTNDLMKGLFPNHTTQWVLRTSSGAELSYQGMGYTSIFPRDTKTLLLKDSRRDSDSVKLEVLRSVVNPDYKTLGDAAEASRNLSSSVKSVLVSCSLPPVFVEKNPDDKKGRVSDADARNTAEFTALSGLSHRPVSFTIKRLHQFLNLPASGLQDLFIIVALLQERRIYAGRSSKKDIEAGEFVSSASLRPAGHLWFALSLKQSGLEFDKAFQVLQTVSKQADEDHGYACVFKKVVAYKIPVGVAAQASVWVSTVEKVGKTCEMTVFKTAEQKEKGGRGGRGKNGTRDAKESKSAPQSAIGAATTAGTAQKQRGGRRGRRRGRGGGGRGGRGRGLPALQAGRSMREDTDEEEACDTEDEKANDEEEEEKKDDEDEVEADQEEEQRDADDEQGEGEDTGKNDTAEDVEEEEEEEDEEEEEEAEEPAPVRTRSPAKRRGRRSHSDDDDDEDGDNDGDDDDDDY